MRSDLIDIVVEDKGDEVIISLSGMFGIKEFAALKEKLERLLQGPGIFFYLNLDKAWEILELYQKPLSKSR